MGLFGRFLALLPMWLQRIFTALYFWPSFVSNRLVCWLCPWRRQLFSPVGDAVLLGAIPYLSRDVHQLVARERVTAVVNTCDEWAGHPALYRDLGVAQLHLPVIDFAPPTLAQLIAATDFLRDRAARRERTLVHCKAGRGRSAYVVLAHLMRSEGISAHEALKRLRAARPHVACRADAPVVTEFQAWLDAQ